MFLRTQNGRYIEMKNIALCTTIIILLAGISSLAQSRAKPAASPKTGIRSVDFRNFTYDDVDGNRVTIRKGRNMSKGEYSSGTFGTEFDSVKYIDFDGDRKEEALVVLGYSQEAAGAYWVQDYRIFSFQNGKPQQIFHESRYKGSGYRVSGRSLVIYAPFWRDDDAHCCPSSRETSTYGWRKGNFKRISRKLTPWK